MKYVYICAELNRCKTGKYCLIFKKREEMRVFLMLILVVVFSSCVGIKMVLAFAKDNEGQAANHVFEVTEVIQATRIWI